MKGQSLNQLPVRHPKNSHEAGETKPWTDSFLRRRKIRLCRRLPTLRLAALLRKNGCCLRVFFSDASMELESWRLPCLAQKASSRHEGSF